MESTDKAEGDEMRGPKRQGLPMINYEWFIGDNGQRTGGESKRSKEERHKTLSALTENEPGDHSIATRPWIDWTRSYQRKAGSQSRTTKSRRWRLWHSRVNRAGRIGVDASPLVVAGGGALLLNLHQPLSRVLTSKRLQLSCNPAMAYFVHLKAFLHLSPHCQSPPGAVHPWSIPIN
ncbi:uncharacterized protein SPSK_03646 [Sporothrix schenckii 1099-18]|uniref:Uncharacterized protein n=1 Tax=Sporothrix schenckii 1099-18 TaxID=1397361 RepID=A0A0F2M3J7_SPOSC|nr:uncharacterized protein SPSK_03646 [Sporothrix schenckii 1099-18]KJR82726.1 hypothetical protein SPSK_03646 [Sporothrix schenckii 1099-18]